jgi:serine/threonine protein kinase
MQGGGRAVGRYVLRAELGSGGFATVYRAHDPLLDRDIALKVLHPHLTRNAFIRDRFVKEGYALARVRHNNAVQIYDAGEVDGATYLAMELIEGRSLRDILDDNGSPPLAQVVQITDDIAAALAAVHARNLVHRDVKPDNILVEEETGRTVLLDLGIARQLDSTITSSGILGTPSYMAPEQLSRDKPVSPQTDVYQLGATVYSLFACRTPFNGDTFKVLDDIRFSAPPDLAGLRPDLPAAVIASVAEAMSKDPARRPQGTRAFAASLRAAAGLTPLPAPPTTSSGPGWQGTTAHFPPLQSPPAYIPAAPARTPSEDIPTQQTVRRSDTPAPVTVQRAATPAEPRGGATAPFVTGDVSVPLSPAGTRVVPAPVPESPTERRRRRGPWLPAGAAVAAVVLIAVVAFMFLRGDGSEARARGEVTVEPSSIPTTTATPVTQTPTPAPVPVLTVSDFKVCDNLETCRQGEFEVTGSMLSCFTFTAGGDGRPLTVVVAGQDQKPGSGDDPAVLARSAPIRQSDPKTCYPVTVLNPPLPPGTYRASVLGAGNSEALARADFRALAPPSPTPEPTPEPTPSPATATAAPVRTATPAPVQTTAPVRTVAPVQPATVVRTQPPPVITQSPPTQSPPTQRPPDPTPPPVMTPRPGGFATPVPEG